MYMYVYASCFDGSSLVYHAAMYMYVYASCFDGFSLVYHAEMYNCMYMLAVLMGLV